MEMLQEILQNSTSVTVLEITCWFYFLTHFVPGVVLLLLSLWWTVNVLHGHFESLTGGQPFRSRMFYLGPIRSLPLESWFSLIFFGSLTIGFLAVCLIDPRFLGIEHAAAFAAFALAGLLQLLMVRQLPLPERSDAAMFAIAMLVKSFFTYHHVHGQGPELILAHMFTILNECGLVAAVLLESLCPQSATCALFRPLLMAVEGTWLMQVSFGSWQCPNMPWSRLSALYVTPMSLVISFTWHYVLHCVAILLLGCVLWRRRSGRQGAARYVKVKGAEMA